MFSLTINIIKFNKTNIHKHNYPYPLPAPLFSFDSTSAVFANTYILYSILPYNRI